MPNVDISNLIVNLLIVAVVVTIVGARIGVGPVLWLKRARGRRVAQEGRQRRELVERVRQLLPQANDGNVIFSMRVESSSSGGSQVKVITNTYYPLVYVVEEGQLWVIPFSYDKGKRTYELGKPAALPLSAIKHVELTGKRNKSLRVTFYVGEDGNVQPLVMVLEPFCFRKNRFYPFDLLQEAACDKALRYAEQAALAASGKTPEDLEMGRLKHACSNYGMYAAIAGFFGVMFSAGELPVMVAICFAISLFFFVRIFACKRVPKLSLIIVIVEAVVAYIWLK